MYSEEASSLYFSLTEYLESLHLIKTKRSKFKEWPYIHTNPGMKAPLEAIAFVHRNPLKAVEKDSCCCSSDVPLWKWKAGIAGEACKLQSFSSPLRQITNHANCLHHSAFSAPRFGAKHTVTGCGQHPSSWQDWDAGCQVICPFLPAASTRRLW